jgi:hypothetical protein
MNLEPAILLYLFQDLIPLSWRVCRATPWRVWTLLQRELYTAISGVCEWNLSRWAEAVKVLEERPRRRQLQQVPARINQLIEYCRANGLSNI